MTGESYAATQDCELGSPVRNWEAYSSSLGGRVYRVVCDEEEVHRLRQLQLRPEDNLEVWIEWVPERRPDHLERRPSDMARALAERVAEW